MSIFTDDEAKSLALALKVVGEKTVPQATRDKAAKSGAALPDGSFPILNGNDLVRAIRAVGRSKDPAAAKAHIVKRAKALGLTKMLPDSYQMSDEQLEVAVKTYMRGGKVVRAYQRGGKTAGPASGQPGHVYTQKERDFLKKFAFVIRAVGLPVDQIKQGSKVGGNNDTAHAKILFALRRLNWKVTTNSDGSGSATSPTGDKVSIAAAPGTTQWNKDGTRQFVQRKKKSKV